MKIAIQNKFTRDHYEYTWRSEMMSFSLEFLLNTTRYQSLLLARKMFPTHSIMLKTSFILVN